MKPADVFALPTLGMQPWPLVGTERLYDVFKVSNIDLDHREGDEPDDAIIFKEKLSCAIGEGERVGVTVVEFDTVPFAILNTRSRQPVTCFVTDEDIMKEATQYLLDRQLPDPRRRVVGTFFDTPEMTEFGEARLITVDNAPRLVKRAHVSVTGDRLIFDELAYFKAMTLLTIDGRVLPRQLEQEVVYTAILGAIPKDIERTRLDDVHNWIGVRASWDGIDYQIGVPAWTARYAHIDNGYRVSIITLNADRVAA